MQDDLDLERTRAFEHWM